MAKPQYLYHTSPNKRIKVLKPVKGKTPSNFNEGPVVFATPSIAYASIFLPPVDSMLGGQIGGVFYFVCRDSEEFIKNDEGGCVYKLRNNGFTQIKKLEWYSKDSVYPIEKKLIKSSIKFMIDTGVKVYFVDERTFKRIRFAPDHGVSVMNSLVSENEKRGIDVEKFNIHKKT